MKRSVLGFAVASLILAACAPARQEILPARGAGLAPSAPANQIASSPPVPAGVPAPTFGAAKSDATGTSATTIADRVVVRTGSRTIVVNDPAQAAQVIAQLAQDMGGFVVSMDLSQTTYPGIDRPLNQGNVTVRVPATRLDEALQKIEALAVEVRQRNETGQDVTAQYTDLQARLQNLQSAESQLRQIMASATKTEDVLAVYNQLVQVQGEIESLQGQIRYLDETSSFAQISVELEPYVPSQPLQIGGWHPSGTAREALQALVIGLQRLGDAVIWAGICGLPFLLLLAIPGSLIAWAVRRQLRRRRSASLG
jgi:chromosome segregation ATPase